MLRITVQTGSWEVLWNVFDVFCYDVSVADKLLPLFLRHLDSSPSYRQTVACSALRALAYNNHKVQTATSAFYLRQQGYVYLGIFCLFICLFVSRVTQKLGNWCLVESWLMGQGRWQFGSGSDPGIVWRNLYHCDGNGCSSWVCRFVQIMECRGNANSWCDKFFDDLWMITRQWRILVTSGI